MQWSETEKGRDEVSCPFKKEKSDNVPLYITIFGMQCM